MATGAPIVCSDIEGYRAVAHAEGSVLVPPRNPAALAAAIEEVGKDPGRRALMGAVNLEHVKTYDWSRVVRVEYLVAIDRRAVRSGRLLPLPAPVPMRALPPASVPQGTAGAGA